MKYVALLRGINVGGNRKVPMADLKACLEQAGFSNVKTYIQSGNVLFESTERRKEVLIQQFESAASKTFGFEIPTVLLTKNEFESIIQNVPKDWMKTDGFKYNYIFLTAPYDMNEVTAAIGRIKPELETLTPGEGVLYQSMSIRYFGRTTFSKIIGTPVYKKMTIRNHNTVTKLWEFLQA